MPIPTWSVGQVLAAADVNSWFVPVEAYKAASTSRTSTTTMTADPDLVIAVAANAIYTWESVLVYDGGPQGSADFKLNWTGPSGTTYVTTLSYVNTSGTQIGATYYDNTNGSFQAGSNGSGTPRTVLAKGSIDTAATAGNFTLVWAQGTSNGTATRVYAGSVMTAQRIS